MYLMAISLVPVAVPFWSSSGITAGIRPDLVPRAPLYLLGSNFPGGRALNPAAFMDPPTTPAGCNPRANRHVILHGRVTLSRNALRGFGATHCDFAVHRDFQIQESLKRNSARRCSIS